MKAATLRAVNRNLPPHLRQREAGPFRVFGRKVLGLTMVLLGLAPFTSPGAWLPDTVSNSMAINALGGGAIAAGMVLYLAGPGWLHRQRRRLATAPSAGDQDLASSDASVLAGAILDHAHSCRDRIARSWVTSAEVQFGHGTPDFDEAVAAIGQELARILEAEERVSAGAAGQLGAAQWELPLTRLVDLHSVAHYSRALTPHLSTFAHFAMSMEAVDRAPRPDDGR